MNTPLWSGITNALLPHAAMLTKMEQFSRQAAVMVLITDEPSPQLIFTLRAKHLTYHAGEICFPGGMWEPQDTTLLASALRETEEEIGLPASSITVLGVLPVRTTGTGTAVTPFVACIPADYDFTPNHDELDAIFSIPLAEFIAGLQVREDIFERNNTHYRIPAYVYQGYEIWGFTAAVTAELLALTAAVSVELWGESR